MMSQLARRPLYVLVLVLRFPSWCVCLCVCVWLLVCLGIKISEMDYIRKEENRWKEKMEGDNYV